MPSTLKLKRSILACAIASLVSAPAFATNGMNMEAFGAKAGGMGGASFGYDSGNSAVMNNPATLALRKEGSDFGIGMTILMPDVEAEVKGTPYKAESEGNSYLMPSMSLIRKQSQFAYGVAMLAQGGMGTEYRTNNFLSLSGEEIRSELSFGRLMFPLAYQVNDSLAVAGQVDFIWGGLDMMMDMSGEQLGGMMQGQGGSVGGSLAGALPAFQPNWARFEFSNDSHYTGQTMGTGFGFKLGLHYKIDKDWAVGATYHSKTNISDMDGSGALKINSSAMGSAMTIPVLGDFYVRDFQWPETYGVGIAWNATDKLMIAADVKRLMWSDSMDSFRIGFRADQSSANYFGPGMDFRGGTMEVSMDQNWDDQTVFMLGAQYMVTPNFALRAGVNIADNPIPDNTLNPLFPAIVEEHYTVGFGWRISPAHSVAASFAYAPEVDQTNPYTNVTSTHSQSTARINYNYRF